MPPKRFFIKKLGEKGKLTKRPTTKKAEKRKITEELMKKSLEYNKVVKGNWDVNFRFFKLSSNFKK